MKKSKIQNASPLPFNVEGEFYIDERCDGCGQCLAMAIDNISFDASDVFCYIYRQPTTQKEENEIEQAMIFCPLCAIQSRNK